MKAYVFSIGEKTTNLCCDLLTEYGHDVILYQDQTSLWEKLKRFYTEALETEDREFMRVDADIIPYPDINYMENVLGWTCAWGFDWYKQQSGAISIHKMNREVIGLCLKYIKGAEKENRPESYLWRRKEINKFTGYHGQRDGYDETFDQDLLFGIHGYGQGDHRQRIKDLKASRNQQYNWSLVERIEGL